MNKPKWITPEGLGIIIIALKHHASWYILKHLMKRLLIDYVIVLKASTKHLWGLIGRLPLMVPPYAVNTTVSTNILWLFGVKDSVII